ncbi:hypothetical protein CUN61_16675 [Pseudomonas arsenicoxydans]|uniref:Ig-like domain (Group 3) n=2 Tax=Pseudomonas arsenicoxydans TaxID=702115 RepID=A0A4P6GJ38_9PSED|nr:hypothetical protein CUN61_16675 [Pseudomonas arsenicoxydans]
MNGQDTKLVTEELPPPYIRESRALDLLNPLALRHSCRIVMEYDIEPGDRVSVTWAGAPGAGSYTSVFFPVGELRPLEVGIGGIPLVIFNLGMTVTLTYTVIRGNSAPVTSQPLILYVLPIALSELPRPFITQAPGFGTGLVLDVSALTEFTLRINAWPLQASGQYFWLRLRGTNANDSVFNELLWSAPGNVVDEKFDKGFYAQNYSADRLKGLKDQSRLTLEFMVGLQGLLDPADAQRFAHRNYIVSTTGSTRPVIDSVKDPLGDDVADGADTEHGSVTVEGTAVAGEQVEIFDGLVSKGKATADSGRWKLQVTGLTDGQHELKAKALYGEGEVSRSWTINVMLKDRQLSIKESRDNITLDPLEALQSLTAVLDYEMEPSDSITVTCTAEPGTPAAGSHTTNPVLAGNIRPRVIPLPVPLLAFSLGKKLVFTFTYTRGASLPVTSPPFALNVLTIPTAEFVAPVITQANGTTVLDLKDVTAGATLLFGGWPHMAMGQRIWLDLEGTNTSGASHNLNLWTGTRNSVHRSWASTGSYSVTLAYSYLQQLRDGSKLAIRFRVNMDQVADPETAVVFDVREYTIRAIP